MLVPMTITVNGTNEPLEPGTTVARLLEAKQLSGKPCAVEVNRALVPKADHARTTLSDGDIVELVPLVGGG